MILKARHFAGAILLHALVLAFLLGGAQCCRAPEPVAVIQGTLISANQLPREQADPTPQPKTEEPPSPEPVPATPPPAPPKPDPAEAQRAQEQQKQKEQDEQKAKDEAKRKAEALVQKQQEEARIKAEQAAAELKKQAEAEEKKRAAEEAKKKAAAEEQKRLDDLRKAAEAEEQKRAADEKRKKDLQARLDAEAKRQREAALAQALGAETAERQKQDGNEWATQLAAAITRAWTRPPGADGQFRAVISIRLSATGEVLSARIRTPSGNPQFDDSAVRAAYKASPMPLPRNPTVFDENVNVLFAPS